MKRVLKYIAEFFVMVFKGQLIMNMHLERKFTQIAYTICLLIVIVLAGLVVDSQLVKVESNNRKLHDLEIIHTQKSYEYQRLYRQSTVSGMLRERGSAVDKPSKPAINLVEQ